MKAEAIKSVVLAAVAALIFAAGWAVEGWRMGAEIARIKQSYSDAQRQAAEDNAAILAEAQVRVDDIARRLAISENALNQTALEKENAIRRLTTGRPCLDSAAVRVLNQPAGREQSRPVPEASGEPVRADATFATDTDVGTWIAGCQRSYDTCRGRLDAIAEFYQSSDRGE